MRPAKKITILLFTLFPFLALAQSFPVFPMAFYGEVRINGNSAPVGTVIRAYYGNILGGEVVVQEPGIYGYTEPMKQKLLVGEGEGEIIFKFQNPLFNNGIETAGAQIQKEPGFISGKTVNKDLSFAIPTPTPTPALTQSSGGGGGWVSTPTPTSTPIVRGATITHGDPANLTKYNLKEGDMVSATGSSDPDVYIINIFGYKRLFLNPAIFNFYGHLTGGWKKIKKVTSEARDAFPTSSLFRNCETNDPKVYALEVTGEDEGVLHWVNMSGDQAVAEDPEFFKKVFCINNNEFNWYTKSSISYTLLSQVPVYNR